MDSEQIFCHLKMALFATRARLVAGPRAVGNTRAALKIAEDVRMLACAAFY